VFRHRIRVRYAEIDGQGVVFNAHWLTYFDDSCTRFMETLGFGPEFWTVEFDVIVRPIEHGGETDDVVTLFSDKYLPALDLLQREGNRIGVGEKRDPIAGIVQRCAPLQLL